MQVRSTFNRKIIGYVVFFALIFLFFYEINHFSPYVGEDYGLRGSIAQQKIHGLAKVEHLLSKMERHFTHWNSRFGEHLAIIFLAFNKEYFNVLNSVVSVILIYIISVLGNKRGLDVDSHSDLLQLALIFCAIILLYPTLGDTFFWLTGATNYLWGLFSLLLFFAPYWLLISGKPPKDSNLNTFLIVILGLISGTSNENTVPSIILLVFLILVYPLGWRKKVGFIKWPYFGFVALCGGFSILYFSPSTKYRIETYNKIFGIKDNSLGLYFERLTKVAEALVVTHGMLFLVILCLLGITLFLYGTGKIRKERVHQLFWPGIFFVISLTSAADLIFSPYFENRAFGLIFIASLVLLISIINILLEFKLARYAFTVSCIVLLLIAGLEMHGITDAYVRFAQDVRSRQQQIESEIKKGNKHVAVHQFKQNDNRILNTRDSWLFEGADGPKRLSTYYDWDVKILPYESKPQSVSNIVINNDIKFDYSTIETREQKYKYFAGWALMPGANLKDANMFIVLKKENGEFIVFDAKIARYGDTAFDGLIDKKFLGHEKYEIWMGLMEGKTLYVKNSGKVIDL